MDKITGELGLVVRTADLRTTQETTPDGLERGLYVLLVLTGIPGEAEVPITIAGPFETPDAAQVYVNQHVAPNADAFLRKVAATLGFDVTGEMQHDGGRIPGSSIMPTSPTKH